MKNIDLNDYCIEDIYTIINFLEELEDDEFDLYKLLYLLNSNLVDRVYEHYEYKYGGIEDED